MSYKLLFDKIKDADDYLARGFECKLCKEKLTTSGDCYEFLMVEHLQIYHDITSDNVQQYASKLSGLKVFL